MLLPFFQLCNLDLNHLCMSGGSRCLLRILRRRLKMALKGVSHTSFPGNIDIFVCFIFIVSVLIITDCFF